jgi:predicted aconitase with swiveling domain
MEVTNMKEIRINGRKEFGGQVTGAALVSPGPLEGFSNCNVREGYVSERNHPLYGIPYKGKILVYTYARGSGGFAAFGQGPNIAAAFVHHKSNSLSVSCAALARIPSVADLEIDPTTVIETGDTVFVNGDEGYVVVYKKD